MNGRLLKFGAVGLLNTGADLLAFGALTAAGCPVLAAQALSYGCGMLNSYLLNRSWTFRSRAGRMQELPRFALLNLAVLAVVSWLLELLHAQAGLPLLPSKLLATGAGMLINYAGSRYWVFGARGPITEAKERDAS
ncbi:GtrA family protein [Paenibacillus sp. MWE-103]|uniref:GtrA family protein n=1 Tax=Paenibacillus artemisiicola TaxID=1172618 RepID=A0ABS3WH29_9BACL|nr:GtrA family protein [Paenibacillus artemisiicola]MBO7747624.1 GtrA family protein [Paenibacillus artemisiicola]